MELFVETPFKVLNIAACFPSTAFLSNALSLTSGEDAENQLCLLIRCSRVISLWHVRNLPKFNLPDQIHLILNGIVL